MYEVGSPNYSTGHATKVQRRGFKMGAPGPPGPFDLQKFFRAPPQSPYQPQSPGYQPSSPGSSFHHQHSSYPPGNSAPSNYQQNTSGYSNVQGSNYPYNTTTPQQSGSPVYHGTHGPQYMHYNPDHGPRPVPYSASPFSQQSSQFSQPPSSPSHSIQPPPSPTMSSIPMSSQPMFSQSKSSQPPSPLPASSLQQGNDRPNTASSQPLDGARLIALLTTQSGGEAVDDDEDTLPLPGPPLNSPRPPLSSRHPDGSHSSGGDVGCPPSPMASSGPGRPSSKYPRGRHLRGDHIIYDVDVRKPGELQPQLEVSPITVYGSENVLVLGRQISVNKKFVCYGLRGGPIRILKINSAQKALLRGHTQRLNDMSFSENVHMLASASQDGRIYVRKILEGNSEDGKVLEHILLALRLVGDWETCHPRLCWHSHLQDTLIVAIGRFIVAINVSKAGQGVIPGGFNGEHPLECRLDSPVKGVYVVGEHEEEVTALVYSLAGPPRLASASKDGTVRIWGDKMQCLSEIRNAHDGGSVDAVAYLSTPRSLDRHILLTAGPLNRELKLWMSEELSFKSSPGGWRCIQTLEFQSSSKPETAFFNHVVVAHRAGLILVANAKRNAIYAIRVDFGPSSAAPRMEYLAEFAVTMPILSVTVADDAISENGEGVLKIYCVQTHAIQQYTLDMSQCLPPADDLHSEGSTPNTPKKSLIVPHTPGTPTSTSFSALDKNYPSLMTMTNPGVSASAMSVNTGIPPRPSAFGSLVESRGQLHVTTDAHKISETKFSTVPLPRDSRDGPGSKPTTPGGHANSEAGVQSNSRLNTRPEASREGLPSSNLTKPPTPPPRRRARSRSPAKADIQYNPVYPGLSRHKVEKEVKDIWLDPEPAAAVEASLSSSSSSSLDESCDKEDREGANSANFQHQSGPQLITPSEIMSLAASAKRDGPQIQGAGLDPMDGTDWQEEEKSSMSGAGKPGINVTDDVPGGSESLLEAADDSTNGHHATGVDSVEKEMMAHNDVWSSPGLNDEVQDGDNTEDREEPNPDDLQEQLKGMALKLGQANSSLPVMQFQTSATLKGRKSKNKNGDRASANISLPTSSQLATMPSGTMSEGEAGNSTPAPVEIGLITQVISMQESLNQLVTVQKELQKQITVMVAVPVSKEGKRLEGALGQRMEKVLKANVDAVWARLAEESAKREKQERERMQQVTSLLTNFMSKDMPVVLERGLKKEIAAIGPAVAQSIAAPIQKSVSTAVSETFQKSVVEKVLPQLEKSTISKLEATMTKQLTTQFQTTGRQALQEALRLGFENLVIPAFEQSCRNMFEQVDSSFQMGMAEHTANTQQQFESSHNALASNLQQAIEGASTLAKTLNEELLDSTGKLLEMVELAGANVSRNVAEVNQSKGTLPEKVHSLQHVEETLDPTIELRRLLQEGKWEEAFNKALTVNDLQVVSWLCHQVEPSAILSGTSPRVSQGVLLSLVLQLSSELAKDTGHKLQWIKEAALALNPDDPHLGKYMRQCLEQAYQNCHCLMGVTTIPSEQANLRLVIHVMNSLMSSCK